MRTNRRHWTERPPPAGPSSIGISVLVACDVETLEVAAVGGGGTRRSSPKTRKAKQCPHGSAGRASSSCACLLARNSTTTCRIPAALRFHVRQRDIDTDKLPDIPSGTRAVSIFLVNQREPAAEHRLADTSYAFQAELEVRQAAGAAIAAGLGDTRRSCISSPAR